MDAILDILNELNPDVDYRDRTDLVDSRTLDSLTIITLVSELEDAFDITIPAVEVVPANFNSLEGMWKMVERMRESGL
ncbi:phosphopantetheine-binding protein [Enorma phocaeensis]|uniref:Phosphopantetheine-binding protein n=1 Tax=Enorma phocaeensis TaxID=1871019 RepID=A0A921IT43_9ACTN|nr:phosphopantetheine-binding protein [Enorma phocaeensis]HJG37302.1 phosphopantetheine-binding protein [Enorma phocaeensis]